MAGTPDVELSAVEQERNQSWLGLWLPGLVAFFTPALHAAVVEVFDRLAGHSAV